MFAVTQEETHVEEWLHHFWLGIWGDLLDVPDGAQVGQIVGRTLVAATLGGILGFEREQKGKAAGIRTHMLVALAAAFFVIIPQQAGMSHADLSRVIQGLAAGVGFLGAGAIIKQTGHGQVVGLTTAAGLYFTTAIGVAAGMGRETTAILGTGLAVVVLTTLPWGEQWFQRRIASGQFSHRQDSQTPPHDQRSDATNSGPERESPDDS